MRQTEAILGLFRSVLLAESTVKLVHLDSHLLYQSFSLLYVVESLPNSAVSLLQTHTFASFWIVVPRGNRDFFGGFTQMLFFVVLWISAFASDAVNSAMVAEVETTYTACIFGRSGRLESLSVSRLN